MSEKITWRHVDRHVRDAHDSRGMLPMGPTDADCTLSYIKWLERTLERAEIRNVAGEEAFAAQLLEIKELREKRAKKSKQRIEDLEENVEIIRRHLGLEF